MPLFDRIVYPDPGRDAGPLVVEKTPVSDMVCPECGSTDVSRYPIAWFKGPRMVVKCQSCYHALSVERPKPEDRWPPFESVAYHWEASPSERASTIGGTGAR